jgi:hypothetical protein
MNDQKNSTWGLYTLRKLVEYAGLFVAIWQFGIPAANQWYEERREAYDKKYHKVPLRQLLSEEMEIPEDRLHIYFGEWSKSHEESEELIDAVYPLLEQEVNNIRPRLEILPGGRATWYHTDGEQYDASIGVDRFYWFHHPTKGWLPCKV